MGLYIDSALLNDITNVIQTIPIAGVTTNPTILLQAREQGQKLDEISLLHELLKIQEGSVFMQPPSSDPQEMLQQARSYGEVEPGHVILKIPMTLTGVQIARQLKEYHIAFTAVATVSQAYCAALCNATCVIPYFGRLERMGIDAGKVVEQMADLLSRRTGPPRILAASLKTSKDCSRALLAGADDLTAPPQTLLSMLGDPLTDEAATRFEQDWYKMKKL